MPQFKYEVRTANGQTNAGVLTAPSLVAAGTMLRQQGGYVLQLIPVSAASQGRK